MLGWTEILLIVAVIILIFGAKRIPELARSLGRASAEFKKGRDSDPAEEPPAEKPAIENAPKDEQK